MTEEHLFTCKECGSHDLRVVRHYSMTNPITKTLYCDCGNASDEIAAEREILITARYEDWGLLDDHHRWDYQKRGNKVKELDEEKERYEVFCHECLEDAEADDWETEEGDGEIDENSYEYFIYCDGCEREIEFGWSHEHQQGRIWPAECTDFNPWKCLPEPRFEEAWAKKNWLRPSEDEQ